MDILLTEEYIGYMSAEKQKRTKVAVFLLKDGRTKPEDFLLDENAKGISIANIGTVYKTQLPNKKPEWVEKFFPSVEGLTALHRSGAGAVLHVKVKISEDEEKHFLVSFGYGYHRINTSACVEQFGLKVALNAGNLAKIRSVAKRNFSSTPKLSQEQLAIQESIQSFTVDFEQDMMQGMTLVTTDESLGKSVTGSLGVTFTTSHTAATISDLLPNLYEYYISTRYVDEKYDWIDNIKPVQGKTTVDALDAELVKKLNQHTEDNVTATFSPPDLMEWESVLGFSPFPKEGQFLDDEIVLEDYLNKDENGDPLPIEDIKYVRSKQVYKWDVAAESATQHWPLYRCITCEIELDDERYVLSNGKWYMVEQTFATSVDTWFDQLEKVELTDFPLYKKIDKKNKKGATVRSHSEETYNKSLDTLGYDVMDQDFVSSGQHKNIEVCDAFKDKDFVHIKIFTGQSTPISHLLAQATVSSDLFFGDLAFRKAFNKKLKKNKLVAKDFNKPKNDDYTITLAIITNKETFSLPFFSKVNLRATIRRLNMMGLNPRLAFIKGDFS